MVNIIPVKLSQLSDQEKAEIIYRSSLNLEEITRTVIEPLAKEIKTDPVATLLKYTEKWDRCRPEKLVLKREDLKEGFERVASSRGEVLDAFRKAAGNIREFHSKQTPSPVETVVAQNTLGLKFVPFDHVALYVPGGKALYPSSVLMGVIPAQIAGVKEITIISPPNPDANGVPDIVQAMAYEAGATRIVQAGGAQAVLAMANGIKEFSVTAADFIYGPGNIYVSAAKNFAFSQNLCGIDSFAGPSEVLIIGDDSANPHYLAHDFLAQAEHDENAAAILLTTSEQSAKETIVRIDQALGARKDREAITRASVERNGKIIITESLEEAIDFSNEYAPEHLEIQTADNDGVLEKITAAGSVFVGDHAPVAIGDYYSGTNHILPTNRGARFSSGVSVHSFFRRITWQKVTMEGLKNSCDPITLMSKEEGLFDEHGYSVLARFED